MAFFPPTNGLFQGVIRDILNNDRKDKINVITNYNTAGYESHYAIDLDNLSTYWLSQASNTNGQTLTIEITDRFVSLTHYSFSSPTFGYPKSWILEASPDNSQWTVVHRVDDSDIMNAKQGRLFKTKKIVARFFRIVNKAFSSGSQYTNKIRISAIDFYGSISWCLNDCTNVPAFKENPFRCTKRSTISLMNNAITFCLIIEVKT